MMTILEAHNTAQMLREGLIGHRMMNGRGSARPGLAGQGEAGRGMAGRGVAAQGEARLGEAGQGKEIPPRRDAKMRAARTIAVTFFVTTVLTVALDGVWNDFIEYQESRD